MKKFEGQEFFNELEAFLKVLEKNKFTEYVILKIDFKKPKHSDIDILTTKFSKLQNILKKNGYKCGKDLRYYKKNKIPIDLHDKVGWNIAQYSTKKLMGSRIEKELKGHKFYYIGRWDDFRTKIVHDIYTKLVEIKWRIGKKIGLGA